MIGLVFNPKQKDARERARDVLLSKIQPEFDRLYDFFYQVLGCEEAALTVMQSTLRKVGRRSYQENYSKYLEVWLYRLAFESLHRYYPRHISEVDEDAEIPFKTLSLEEKIVLLLKDRLSFSANHIASVLQVSENKVGSLLMTAREGIAKVVLKQKWSSKGLLNLRDRIHLHLRLKESDTISTAYEKSVAMAMRWTLDLPSVKFNSVEQSVRNHRILPILGNSERISWNQLSWQYKLGVEASVLGFVGLLAVLVLPWAFSKVNADAVLAGRFSDLLVPSQVEQQVVAADAISTDRILASVQNAEAYDASAEVDEFAEMEFPSGDSYEVGTAPLAPSRQSAAVYRLIVQSSSPKELIPRVRGLFAQKNVKERESSGRVMPGGVFFDGVTNVGSYPQLVQEIKKLGQTKTYSHNPGRSRNPNERARVIVWVQQI
ncbi:MAG: hypothetical protein M9962_15715 [Oligoflexia bacterium]|nr:hypothetical protein [Oligoflexia bacterium]